MAKIRQVDGIEVAEELGYQHAYWRVQRIGWVVLALLILLGMAGFFGLGMLSDARVTQAGGLSAEYSRFARRDSETKLRVHVPAGSARDGLLRLALDREYIQDVELGNVIPAALHVEAGPQRLYYVFQLTQPDQPVDIDFTVQPDKFGIRTGRVALGDGPWLEFRQLIYP